MRIDLRMLEQLVDPFHDFVRNRVLQLLGFLVDFGPVEPQHFDEKQFNQSMPAQDVQREFFTFRAQLHPAARLVVDEPGLVERFDHRRRRPRRDLHRAGERPHGDKPPARPLLLGVQRLQVILHGSRRHLLIVPP